MDQISVYFFVAIGAIFTLYAIYYTFRTLILKTHQK